MSSGKRETRQAILQAARRLFERDGPSVRLGDIASQAGISRQGLYLHFESRTDLLLNLVEWIDRIEDLAELIKWVWGSPDGTTAVQRFITLNARYTHKIYPVAKSLMSGRYADDAIAAAWENRMTGRRDTCRKLVYWLQRGNNLSSSLTTQEATDLLWNLTSIQTWEQLVIDSNWSADQYEQNLRQIVNGALIS